MIDIKEINEEIERLENCNCTTYQVCEKLATLYIVREYYSKADNVPITKSTIASPMMTP
ncbi:MAG: hypothetical protein J6T34_00100 [Bacilli bacterium]|nr:hypothetical protein [Bacilli bacterium]